MKSLFLAIVAAGAVAVAACGGDPGSLNNGGGGGGYEPGGYSSSGGTQQPGGGSSSGGTVAPPLPGDNTPPPGVTDNAAKTFFVQKVYPSIETTCGSCHAPPGSAGAPVYLSATSASDAYTNIEARGYIIPSSMLLKKGAHEGPALTVDQSNLVTQWLQLEQQVRGSQAPVDLLAKLGNCLDQTKFNAIGLQNLRTIKRTNENANNCTGCNQAPCQACHQQGEYAMYSNFSQLGTDTFPALQANATSPEGVFIVSKYITTNGTQLVPSTALQDKAKATSTGVAYSHPMFQVSTTMEQAIVAFANDAITKYNAKTCGQ
jgi:hypothetical protein